MIRPLNTALLLTIIFIKQGVNGQNFPDYKNHIENVMNLYKESFNSNDFLKLEPYVIKEFSAGEMEPHHAQQFIRAKINSEKESNIQDFSKF